MSPTNSAAVSRSLDWPAWQRPGYCSFSSSCRRRGGRRLENEAGCQDCRSCKRCSDSGDAGRPAEMIEQLAERGASDEAAEEIAGEIGSAGDAAIVLRGLPDKAGGTGLRKEGADADQHHAGQHLDEMRGQH